MKSEQASNHSTAMLVRCFGCGPTEPLDPRLDHGVVRDAGDGERRGQRAVAPQAQNSLESDLLDQTRHQEKDLARKQCQPSTTRTARVFLHRVGWCGRG